MSVFSSVMRSNLRVQEGFATFTLTKVTTTAICLSLVATLLAGCGGFATGQDLIGTAWSVTQLDGEVLPEGEVYLFLDSDSATLTTHLGRPHRFEGNVATRCRESVSELVMDTDGQALNFNGFVPRELSRRDDVPCDESLQQLHDRVADALGGNDSWEATSDSTIDLVGTSRVTLEGDGGSD